MTTPSPYNYYAVFLISIVLGVQNSYAQSSSVEDPFESLNRASFTFNDRIDRALLRPAAVVYRKVLPTAARSGLSNFFENAGYPLVIVSQFMQGKAAEGVQDSLRFVVNTTIGLGGIIDVATKLGLPTHEEDFGQMLGHWGVESGPYLVIPFFGPSSFRDGIGTIPGYFLNLTNQIDHIPTRNSVSATAFIVQREALFAAEQVVSGDRYLFIRDAFLQQREFLVNDGSSTEDPFLED